MVNVLFFCSLFIDDNQKRDLTVFSSAVQGQNQFYPTEVHRLKITCAHSTCWNLSCWTANVCPFLIALSWNSAMQCQSCCALSTLITQSPSSQCLWVNNEASARMGISEILQRILIIFPLVTMIFTPVLVYVDICSHYNTVWSLSWSGFLRPFNTFSYPCLWLLSYHHLSAPS